jgi:hypothetical protein
MGNSSVAERLATSKTLSTMELEFDYLYLIREHIGICPVVAVIHASILLLFKR